MRNLLDARPGMNDESMMLEHFSRFHSFRHHRIFSSNEIFVISQHEVSAILAGKGVFSRFLSFSDQQVAYAVVAPCEWESGYFAVPMARLYFGCVEGCPAAELKEFLSSVVTEAFSSGFSHLSLVVDAEDIVTARIVSALGFVLVDTKLRFCATRAEGARRESGIVLRDYRLGDSVTANDIVQQAVFPSRFTHDDLLDQSRIPGMYGRWLKRLVESASLPGAGILVCAERRGELAAVGGIEPVRFAGMENEIHLLGNSLLACRARAHGAGYSIVANVINRGLAYARAIDFSTSAANHAMIRILEAHQCKLATSSYCFRLTPPAVRSVT